MSIVDKLSRLNNGVVQIAVSADNTKIEFSDGEFGFNRVALTKAEVLELAEELIIMAVTLE